MLSLPSFYFILSNCSYNYVNIYITLLSKVILMIEKEQDYEKEIVERVKREIKEESKKNKGRTLRMVGLIISGVGGLLYFIIGFIFLFATIGYMLWVTIPLLIAGAINKKVKKLEFKISSIFYLG